MHYKEYKTILSAKNGLNLFAVAHTAAFIVIAAVIAIRSIILSKISR